MPRAHHARPPVPAPIGALFALVYGAVVGWRNAAFDAGRGVERVGAAVISIGNLSTGGTGKSPMVLWTIGRLREMGKRPGVATRGYKAKRGELGDEQREMLRRMPDLAIEANPVRASAAKRLIEQGCDAVVLDDGFQHRKLARDLDIVLIDATRPAHTDHLLPRGHLREPRSSLARAHAVVITRCELVSADAVDAIEADALRINPRLVVARSEHQWDGVEVNGAKRAVEMIRGKRVVLACGLGNPGAFESAAERSGMDVVGRFIKPDHHEWSTRDSEQLVRACQRIDPAAALLTSAKDWAKLARFLGGETPIEVIVPELRIAVTRGEDALVELLGRASGGGE